MPVTRAGPVPGRAQPAAPGPAGRGPSAALLRVSLGLEELMIGPGARWAGNLKAGNGEPVWTRKYRLGRRRALSALGR